MFTALKDGMETRFGAGWASRSLMAFAVVLCTTMAGGHYGCGALGEEDDGAGDVCAEFCCGAGCDLIDEGIRLLEQGLYQDASAVFQDVLQNYHPDNPQAKFGYVFADGMLELSHLMARVYQTWDEFESITGISAEDLNSTAGRVKLAKMVQQADDLGVTDVIGGMVEAMIGPFLAKLYIYDQHLADVLTHEDFYIYFETLPLHWHDWGDFAYVPGRYDLVEVHFFKAFLGTLTATFEFANSVDFSMNMLDMAGAIIDGGTPFNTFIDDTNVDHFFEAMVWFFEADDDFLGFGDDGLEHRIAAGNAFAIVFDGLLGMITQLDAEHAAGTDQSQDVIYRPEEQLIVIRVIGDEGRTFAVDTLNEQGFILDYSWDMAESLGRVVGNLQGEGVRASWAQDILPLLATAVDGLIASGMLGNMIEGAADGDAETQELLTTLLSPDYLNRELITDVVADVTGDAFELDFRSFFDTNVSLRGLLPAWTTSRDPNVFIMEWECSYGNRWTQDGNADWGGFACPFNAPDLRLSDSGHFCGPGDASNPACADQPAELVAEYAWTDEELALVEPIAADGLALPAPIIGFQDATFGGMVWFDPSYIPELEEPAGYALATSRNLNAWFGYTISRISDMVNDLD